MEQVDCVVVGAGVVGLACARALALAGREVLLLEGELAIGTGTSSRNSEVIHAGLYYRQGSLKAVACVAGRHALYRYCAERGIEARAVGKLVVATSPAERETLDRIAATAAANGVDDLRVLSAADVRALEPDLATHGALFSPSSGIVDSHALMGAYQGDLEAAGGAVAFGAPLEGARVTADGLVLAVGGADPMDLRCRTLVNASGLHAPALARRIAGLAPAHVPRAFYAKGNYYALSSVRAPFRRLVYPVPEQAGLGIHATLDLGGQVKFGPDVEWVERIDYDVDPARAAVFYDAIRRYWPALPDGALVPAYAGVRPKIVGPGAPAADFVVQGPAVHGVPGLVNLFGIESPGLTASLALGEHVARMAA